MLAIKQRLKKLILPVVLYGYDLVSYTQGGTEAEGVSEQDALLFIAY
jgi:hypothetical protein